VNLPVFSPPARFARASRQPTNAQAYRLLPFEFIALDADPRGRHIIVNQAGEHEVVSRDTLEALVHGELSQDAAIYDDLKAKHFLADTAAMTSLTLLATKVRTKYSFLDGFTRLHIFVVTLRCDHSCYYCQVSRVSSSKSKYDMTPEAASHSLDLVFRAPAREIKIEFQGGEPLLNFELIRFVVADVDRRNALLPEHLRKAVQFVVTTNLSFIDNEILAFLEAHRIHVSTSLDGPAFIHNANRPRPGNDAYETTVQGIDRVRQALGHNAVAALMTTTRLSLEHPVAIVDEYANRGFDYIFLRPLSPYGFAVKTQRKTGYDRTAFLDFYRNALDRVIEINRSGKFLIEVYAQIILTKILTPFATGYVDLQSPAGAGIGAVVYNYDGDVYASDEARMLAEMGDKKFRLGNVFADSYSEIFGGPVLRELVNNSCVDSLPGCSDCAFRSYCGADPIENHTTQGDIIGHRPTSDFCTRNMGIITHLLQLYHSGDPFIRELFWSWVQNTPADVMTPTVPA
jgi:uncharacterized protein